MKDDGNTGAEGKQASETGTQVGGGIRCGYRAREVIKTKVETVQMRQCKVWRAAKGTRSAHRGTKWRGGYQKVGGHRKEVEREKGSFRENRSGRNDFWLGTR